jgi:hypothetical protein
VIIEFISNPWFTAINRPNIKEVNANKIHIFISFVIDLKILLPVCSACKIIKPIIPDPRNSSILGIPKKTV